MKKQLYTFGFLSIILFALTVVAEETETKSTTNYVYFGFEPEIVTNYLSSRGQMGYVRASIELMVSSPAELTLLEYHEPLLRAGLIEILGNQPSERIKSLSGREDIRRECYDTLNQLLNKETGKTPIVNLLFTRYLYD